jgi:hypothetical protein
MRSSRDSTNHFQTLELVSRMLLLREKVDLAQRDAALAHLSRCSRCRDALRLLSSRGLRALAPAGLPELPPPRPRLPRRSDPIVRPWFLALGDRLVLHELTRALFFFVVLGGALTGLNLVLESWLEPTSHAAADARQVFFYPLSFAYILAGVSVIVSRQSRAVHDLVRRNPYLEPERPHLSEALNRYPRRDLWLSIVAGVSIALLAAEGAADRIGRVWADPAGLPLVLLVEGVFLWILAAPAMYVVGSNAGLLYRLGEDVEVDLDHLSRLRPFGDAALWAGGVLCGWPLLLLTLLGYGADAWLLPAAGALASAFIALVVCGSTWSVHARIRDLKRLEPFRAEPASMDVALDPGSLAVRRGWPFPLWRAAAVTAAPLVGLSMAALLHLQL